jgi:hypothetical protein
MAQHVLHVGVGPEHGKNEIEPKQRNGCGAWD